jgi:hypothetical protein
MSLRFITHQAAGICRMEHTARIDDRRQKPNRTNMKTTLRTLILAAITASLVTTVSAAPPGKGLGTFKKASTQEEIQKIKKGSRYALVCKECESVTVKEAADDQEAAKLCHDGGTVHCASCDKKLTVKRTGPPGKENTSSKVTIVNAEGKECMFIVPLSE